MQWSEIRQHYPKQWLLVEALAAHSAGGQWIVHDLAVLETFRDPAAAMKSYQEIHHRSPQRELYVLHADREALDISEINWLGIRTDEDPRSTWADSEVRVARRSLAHSTRWHLSARGC